MEGLGSMLVWYWSVGSLGAVPIAGGSRAPPEVRVVLSLFVLILKYLQSVYDRHIFIFNNKTLVHAEGSLVRLNKITLVIQFLP